MSDLNLLKANEKIFMFEDEQTITAEERDEVFQEIDRLVSEKKVHSDKEVWRIKAQRSGITLPLILNSVILVLVIGLLWTILTFFQTNSMELRNEETQLVTTEAMLLEEIKKESEVVLGEKDREIVEIQKRLSSIENEKAAIYTDAETKYNIKVSQLKQRLQEDLSRERLSLVSQGLNKDELERRIEAYANRRQLVLETELKAFRSQAEDESRQLERTLNEIRSQYQSSLSTASIERQQLQESARRKESEYLSRQVRSSPQLQKSRAELERLHAINTQVTALDTQINGLIRQAREQFAVENWLELKKSAESISHVASLHPFETSQDALTRRAGHQLISQTLNMLADIQLSKVKAYKSKNQEGSIVDKLPLVQLAWREAEALLRSAESDWDRGNYTSSLEKSSRAVARLGLTKSGNNNFFGRWVDHGGKQALKERVTGDTSSAQSLWVKAQADADTSPDTSRSLLTDLLISFPLAIQRTEAMSLLVRLGESSNLDSTLQKRVFELKEEMSRLHSASESKNSEHLNQENTDLKLRVTRLQAQVQELQAIDQSIVSNSFLTENTKLQKKLTELQTELKEAQTLVSQADERNKLLLREKTDLSSQANQFTAMLKSYNQYLARVQALSSESSQDSKKYLSSFLVDVSTNDRFSSLETLVQTAFEEAKTAGQTESLYYAADILEGTLRLADKHSLRAYFNQLRKRFRSENSMLEFITVLEDFSQSTSKQDK